MFIHDTADVSQKAEVGKNVKVWNWVQIREDAVIGENTILSKSVYVDYGVRIGKNCKIQNNVSIYHGVIIEDGVFIGPHVCFTNDKLPRAINVDGSLKGVDDWKISEIIIKRGASIGANSVILPGVSVGEFAMIGAGSVVTRDVPAHTLVFGNPAIQKANVCACGNIISGEFNSTVCFDCKKGVNNE